MDNVEIDIDFWPQIPAYVEFEAESEDAIKKVCQKLDIKYNQLVSIDVEKIYNHYGINLSNLPVITLEEEIKSLKYKLT